MATFLLLHGGLCRSWIWEDTVDALSAGGHDVEALDLPSSGPEPACLGGLQDDVATVTRALERNGTGTVLVGHSGAGMALAELAGHPAVRHTVYVAALRPQRGQSIADLLGGRLPDWIRVRPDEGAAQVSDDADVVRRALCADVDEDRFLRDVYPRYVLISLRSLAEVSTAPASRHGTTYVVCEQDQAVPPEAQEAMAADADRVERLASSHSPMLSMPGRLAEVLERAATEP
ncbi:alpha/beta fold hydrolase [Geodermatophilus sp. SYSU D01176]